MRIQMSHLITSIKTMKPILIFCLVMCVTFPCGAAPDVDGSSVEIPLKPLDEAMDKGGLETLNSYLDAEGKWPRITTSSLALKEGNTKHKELVDLSNQLLSLLKVHSTADQPKELSKMESEAGLLFSLSEKLWKADGYRNRAMSLLCSEMGTYECGKIVIFTKGEKMGPQRPAVLKVRDAGEMLSFFISEISEISALSDSGLKEILSKEPVAGGSWFEMIVAIDKIEIGGSTVGNRFNGIVAFRIEPLGTIVSREDLSSLTNHLGWAQVIHDSMLPELALYLKNKGSLEELRRNPTNAAKLKDVLKDQVYRFTTKPVLQGRVGIGQLAIFAEDIETPGGSLKRLFGLQK